MKALENGCHLGLSSYFFGVASFYECESDCSQQGRVGCTSFCCASCEFVIGWAMTAADLTLAISWIYSSFPY